MPICSKCLFGFDLAEGATAACPRCGTGWTPPPAALPQSAPSNFRRFRGVFVLLLGSGVLAVVAWAVWNWQIGEVPALTKRLKHENSLERIKAAEELGKLVS